MTASPSTAPAFDYRARQQRLAEITAARKWDALLVTYPPNIAYLCGFTGSNALLLAGNARPVLFTDGRYIEQARGEVQGARVVISKGPLFWDLIKHVAKLKAGVIGVESDHIIASSLTGFRRLMPKNVKLRDTIGVVDDLRVIKDDAEIAAIRHAVVTASGLFEPLLEAIRPGVAESEIAGRLEYAARRAGASGMSFETIVAGGARSAMPHGRASEAPVPQRGFVILDYGVRICGYCSDMTRTVHVGAPDERARSMYEAVREAQQAALDIVKAGITCAAVDHAARSVLQRAGFGRYFTHSTGHGVGLEIHETPRIARDQKQELRPNMVITIEPGIYLAGVGGVRIEDMVRVTEGGCEVLTPTRKELIEL